MQGKKDRQYCEEVTCTEYNRFHQTYKEHKFTINLHQTYKEHKFTINLHQMFLTPKQIETVLFYTNFTINLQKLTTQILYTTKFATQ